MFFEWIRVRGGGGREGENAEGRICRGRAVVNSSGEESPIAANHRDLAARVAPDDR